MPRQPRVEYEGAVYHVMSRGNAGQKIYFDRQGHELFLETLDEACKKSRWLIHAFVLMPNHYHLLSETPDGNLVDGMRWLQGTFTARTNARRKRRGHLFQGRYKVLLIDSDDRAGSYFRTVADYIHLNPARGGLLRFKGGKPDKGERLREALWHYSWSSYPRYRAWKNRRPGWLVTEKVLGEHGLSDDSKGRRSYSEYLEQRANEKNLKRNSEWDQLRRGWYLGGEAFRDRMLDKVEEVIAGGKGESYSGGGKAEHEESRAERLVGKALEILGVEESELALMKKSAVEKEVVACLVRKQSNVRIAWIAERLQMGHPSSVAVAVQKTTKGFTNAHKKNSKKINKIIDFKD